VTRWYREAVRAPTLLLPLVFTLAACAPSPPPALPPPTSASPPPDAGVTGPAVSTASPPTTDTSPPREDALVDELAKAYLDVLLATSPEEATILGLHAKDGVLDDRTQAGVEQARKTRATILGTVKKLQTNRKLSRAARTDLELLAATLEVHERMWAETRPHERMPSFYAEPMSAIFIMMARDYAPAAERATHTLERMEKLPGVITAAKQNLKNPPKVWTQVGIEMAQGAKDFFEEQRKPLLAALPGEKARVLAAIATAQKAYADYATFLQKEVLPRSNGDFATGRATFDFLLHRSHFLEEDTDKVLALGQKVLAETEARLTETARRIDPNAKSWADVVLRVKGHHPTAENLIPSYRQELSRARAFLVEKDAVPFPPDDDCEVIETPVFLRSTTTAAYDQSPPFDPTTKGFFFVTPVDLTLPKAKQEEMLRENDHGDQVDTTVHEAYPGHHLQGSFGRRHPSILRKLGDAPTFSEGWGLYSEELMSELGYYTDEERLMQLEWTLVRAARVVIDVGLHTKGMSFDDAVKMLTDRVHLERVVAVGEVKRYTMTPTQPLSYVVGREAIFKMRDRYKTREGAKYTLRAFHTDILSHGTIPVGLIAREMFGD
jgi:uncharacterized protein (DUF885 family)